MATKNPASFSFSDFCRGVETVADMQKRQWQIRARCEQCHTLLKVNVRLIIVVRGPQTVLWDSRQPCKVWGCSGRAVFQGRPHPAQKWTDLTTANRIGYLGTHRDPLDGRPVAPVY